MKKKVMREHLKERMGNKHGNISLYPSFPSSLNIEINNTCNHSCIFCPYHGFSRDIDFKQKMMSKNDVITILDVAYAQGIGKKEVGFYISGEAFIHPDLAEIVDYAKKKGFKYTFLTTNGSLASPKKMKSVIDAGLDSIRFSINAADAKMYKEIHGKDDFDTVINNIRFMHEYLSENKIPMATSISCVITKKTIGIKEKLNNILGDYVDDIICVPVLFDYKDKNNNVKLDYQLFDENDAEIDDNFICPIPFDVMYVDASGGVLSCCQNYGNGDYVGNILETLDFEKIWYDEKMIFYRKLFLEKIDKEGTICETCYLRFKSFVENMDN